MDVVYYHYFLFYKRFPDGTNPHFSTSLALGASESFLLVGLIDIVSLKYFCYSIDYRIFFGISIMICAANCWHFMRGKGEDITEKKPLYLGSKQLSVICTLLFFLISLSWLFWGPIYGKYLLENC